jgi:hypothetical protein
MSAPAISAFATSLWLKQEVGGKMLLHFPHSPLPCGLVMQDDGPLLRLLHSVHPVLQQLPRNLKRKQDKAQVLVICITLLPASMQSSFLGMTKHEKVTNNDCQIWLIWVTVCQLIWRNDLGVRLIWGCKPSAFARREIVASGLSSISMNISSEDQMKVIYQSNVPMLVHSAEKFLCSWS